MMTTNYNFILCFGEFMGNVTGLVVEAYENPNIHNSHPDFVSELFNEAEDDLEKLLEGNNFDQRHFRDILNNQISKIEYLYKQSKNAGYQNVATFYNSVIDAWNEFVEEITEDDEVEDVEANFQVPKGVIF